MKILKFLLYLKQKGHYKKGSQGEGRDAES